MLTSFLLLMTLLRVACLATTGRSLSLRPYDIVKKQRQSTISRGLSVDLGYGIYEGYTNQTSGLDTWKGIRYAAAPVGVLRWQAPQVPKASRERIVQAVSFGPQCPQSSQNIPTREEGFGNEDCLFLNVYAPPNASRLPVLVWIHGGGYGFGNGQQDLSQIIATNDNTFMGVAIQYRLGAVGFLSSDEVFRKGVPNAGILDQTLALQWVQSYISLFGGDPDSVTISGVSAGGGSVMLHAMAHGGQTGASLFQNAIVASPYLPTQYDYNDWLPSQSYYAFAAQAGCITDTAYGGSPKTVFECLVAQDSMKLQYASMNVSSSGAYGTWGFLPVTDRILIQQRPSQQLREKRINGKNLLVGNNANEGPLFTPQNINTEEALVAWLHLTFPLFSDDDIAKILLYYPGGDHPDDPKAADFSTLGDTGPTALNQSSVAHGQQQRADNIYGEVAFVCPSYWLAEAFALPGHRSFKYQYSIPAAQHAADITGYFGPAAPTQGPDFVHAFMTIWGNFIRHSDPSITASIANGNISDPKTPNPATRWPPFSPHAPYQLNLNQTGGTKIVQELLVPQPVPGVNATVYIGPGLQNRFDIVNAYTWEGGRGFRCDFWRSMAPLIPA